MIVIVLLSDFIYFLLIFDTICSLTEWNDCVCARRRASVRFAQSVSARVYMHKGQGGWGSHSNLENCKKNLFDNKICS